MNQKHIQIQTTFETHKDAVKLADLMLDAKLVTCGQI